MDWTQTITLGVAILGYITAMILFLYHLNEKNIEKLESGMKSMETRWDKRSVQMEERWDKRMSESEARWEKSESHWRELFMYMNNKIDEVKKPS